ncbi:MAG: hypothetical protein PF503_14965, partial [Desulfobacula sp.]|nr:hypothetical protein [Desulfobacula sp.]
MNNNIDEIEDVILDNIEQSQAPEITNQELEKAQHPAENTKTLDEIISELPDNFPDANPILKIDILPLIIEMDAGLQDYYTVDLQKKLSVSKQTIKEALKAFKQEMATAAIVLGDDNLPDNEENEIDPENIERAEQLASDPKVFKHRIDRVNSLGFINERLNIGVISMTMDSRLNPMGIKGSNVLAAKNTGKPGAGKTASLMTILELYSKNCYHLLDSGSAKSIYNMEKNALQHKALILNEA